MPSVQGLTDVCVCCKFAAILTEGTPVVTVLHADFVPGCNTCNSPRTSGLRQRSIRAPTLYVISNA